MTDGCYSRPGALRAAFPLLGAVLAASAGCGDAIHNSHEDDRFIRSRAGETTAAAATLGGGGTLFPAAAGARWASRFTLQPLGAPAAGGAPAAATEMDADVVCAAAPAGGTGIARLETRAAGRTAAAARPLLTENYWSDASGVSLAAQGGGGRSLALTPPLPLLRRPVRQGEVARWQGTVRTGGRSLPAVGYSRVSYVETLDLPAGKVGAYRVDTVLLAQTAGGQQASYPMVRWFAPGVGIVKQRFLSGNTQVTQALVRYHAPGR